MSQAHDCNSSEIPSNNKSKLRSRRRRNRATKALVLAAAVAPAALAYFDTAQSARAATYTWNGNHSTYIVTTSNWTTSTAAGSPTGTTNADVAVMPSIKSVNGGDEGSNIDSHTVDPSTSSNYNADYYIGAFDFTDAASQSLEVNSQYLISDNNSTGATTLYLNSATVNGLANTILYDNVGATYTGTSAVTIGNTAGKASLSVMLGGTGNTTNNVYVGTGDSITISSNIGQATSGSGLAISGAGTFVLSGSNNYSGATTVTGGGSFVVGDSSSTTGQSSTGTGSVTLNGTTLSSTAGQVSYVSGAVSTGTGPNGIAPGGTAGAGTLDLGSSLSLGASSTLDFDITGAQSVTASSQLNVTGALNLSGSVNVDLDAGSSGYSGNYVLATFGSITNSSDLSFQTAAPSGYAWVVNTTTDQIDLNVVSTTDTWASTTGTWDISTSPNWVSAHGAGGAYYQDGDAVVFSNSGGTITIAAGGVKPLSTTINNSTNAYIFQDADNTSGIGGAGSVTLSGSGITTFTQANQYSGGTNINGGTLIADGDATLGATTGSINIGGGTLEAGTAITSARAFNVSTEGGTFNTNMRMSSFSAAAAINGTLTVNGGSGGSGLMIFSGASATGTSTQVTFGSTGQLNIAPSTTVEFLQSGGTIAMADGGTISGTLQIGNGTISGNGTSPAEINFDSGTFSGTGVFDVESSGVILSNSSGAAGGNVTNLSVVLNKNGNVNGTFHAGDVSTNSGTFTPSAQFVTHIGGDGTADTSLTFGVISGNSDVDIENGPGGGGAGTIIFNGSSTYTGTTEINNGSSSHTGTIVFDVADALPKTTDVIFATESGVNDVMLNLNGFNQQVGSVSSGADETKTAHHLTITNNGTQTATFTIGGGTAVTSTAFADTFQDGASQLALTIGTGTSNDTVTLSGVNTYSGATTVASGTLVISGSGENLGDTAITVQNGAKLGFTGNTPQVGDSNGTNLNPNAAASMELQNGSTLNLAYNNIGTLTLVGNLNIDGGATIDLNLGSSATSTFDVYGNISASGTNTINFETGSDTSLTAGTYTFLNIISGSGGTKTIPMNGLTLDVNGSTATSFTVSGENYALALVDPDNSEELVIGPATEVASDDVWNTSSGTWDVNTSPNWANAHNANNAYYLDGDNVTFNNPGQASTVTIAAGGVKPTDTVIQNSTNGYTFADADNASGIGGSGSVTIMGTGTTAFTQANQYTGGTFIDSGVLIADGNLSLGGTAGSITIGGGTLEAGTAITGTRTLTITTSGGTFNTNGVTSSFSGGGSSVVIDGTLAVTGSGTLNFNGTGSQVSFGTAGSLNIAAGTILEFAQTSGTIAMADGGTINGTLLMNAARLNFDSGTFSGSGTIDVETSGVILSNTSGQAGGTVNTTIMLNKNGNVNGTFKAGDVSTNSSTFNPSAQFVTHIGGTNSQDTSFTIKSIQGNSDVDIENGAGGGGAGDIYFTGHSTYAGTTEINNGGSVAVGQAGTTTLTMETTNALPTTTDLIVGTESGLGIVTLDIHGYNQQVGSVSDGSHESSTAHHLTIINNGTQTATFTIGGGTAVTNTAFADTFQDGTSQLALTIAGSSNQVVTLSGTNTYSGATTVASGTLNISGSGENIADTAITVENGATLGFTGSTPQVGDSNGSNLNPSAAASIELQSGSNLTLYKSTTTLTLVGNLTLDGGATINLGLGASTTSTFDVYGNITASGTNTINLETTGDASLTAGTYTFLNIISGSGGTKTIPMNGLTLDVNGSAATSVTIDHEKYALSLVDPDNFEELVVGPGQSANSIVSLSPVSAGTPSGFTSGQQILNHAAPTTSYQGVFSTNTNVLTVNGSHGSYVSASATHINSEGAGNTDNNQGNTTAYIEINGFSPAGDEEIAAVGIDDNGTLLTSTADSQGMSTTSIVSDINTLWDSSGQSGTIAYVLAGSSYTHLFSSSTYNVYLDFTSAQLSNLGLNSSGDNYLGIDLTQDPNFDATTTDLTFTAVAVVPEPSSLGLMGLGVMGAMASRRRRRAKKG